MRDWGFGEVVDKGFEHVQRPGSKVQGLGLFGVWDLGSRVWGLGLFRV